MTSLPDDALDAWLEDLNPVTAEFLSSQVLDGALRDLRAALIAAPIVDARQPARAVLRERSWARRRRRLLISAVAAVVVAVALTLAGTGTFTGSGSSGSGPLSVSLAGAAELKQLARAARTSSTGKPKGSGGAEVLSESVAISGIGQMGLEFVHKVVRFRYSADAQLQLQEVSEVQGNSGLGTTENVSDAHVSFPTPAERALAHSQRASAEILAETAVGDSQTNDLQGSPVAIPPNELVKLPDTATALLTRLRADYRKLAPNGSHGMLANRSAYSENQALWGALKSILEQSARPAVIAAAYEALTAVHHLHVGGIAVDARGRKGVAVTFTGTSGQTDSVIIDQSTGQILQRTLTATRPQSGWPAQTIFSQEVWLGRSETFSNPLVLGRPLRHP